MFEDEVLAEAHALARAAGYDPDEIVEFGDPKPVVEDRGDGVPMTTLRHPLRPRWVQFEAEARARLESRNGGADRR